ncbi:MAG: DUF1343 domain-containing protein [Bacteroidaceae bacterium]|nr:DUF1343 domain-containing protein [Bacteroidaceae bacterium]
MKKLMILSLLLCLTACTHAQTSPKADEEGVAIEEVVPAQILTGDQQTALYFPLLEGKRIGVYSNQTGMAGEEHIVDLLKRDGFNIIYILSPEHGFRGDADAGEKVDNSVDAKTGLPIISLYNQQGGKPDAKTMQQIDVLVMDIQDVGLRFYTYYITMCRLMDACAEQGKELIILDRPNPNGMYVDGPILDMKHKSGVGWLPIPVVHGMTLGELAQMVNGEKWLPQGRQCKLTIIPCANYTHQSRYKLTIAPSPNLPNMKSIYLYPSTCLFEGTVMSLGRGTDKPFQIYGHPQMKDQPYSFTPRSKPGATNPPQKDKLCYGKDLSTLEDDAIIQGGLNLDYVIDAYQNLKMGDKFFTSFFEKLIGVDYVRQMIKQGKSAEEIKARWEPDVEKFKEQRKRYLLYEK